MFDRLARLLARPAGNAPAPRRREMAIAVMLAEIARADHRHSPEERATICDLLMSALQLDRAGAEALFDGARAQADAAVSLHPDLQVINAELDLVAKRELLEWLWRVAYADGRLDPREEARIRQIADLLHVPHADFVRPRLRVERERGLET